MQWKPSVTKVFIRVSLQGVSGSLSDCGSTHPGTTTRVDNEKPSLRCWFLCQALLSILSWFSYYTAKSWDEVRGWRTSSSLFLVRDRLFSLISPSYASIRGKPLVERMSTIILSIQRSKSVEQWSKLSSHILDNARATRCARAASTIHARFQGLCLSFTQYYSWCYGSKRSHPLLRYYTTQNDWEPGSDLKELKTDPRRLTVGKAMFSPSARDLTHGTQYWTDQVASEIISPRIWSSMVPYQEQ